MARGEIDTIIKVVATIPADNSNAVSGLASIDIPEDGLITCIGGAISGIYSPGVAVQTSQSLQLTAELSFLSTSQIGVNDSRGSIAGITVANTFLFSEVTETGGGGAKMSEMGDICPPGGIIIQAGERIHLHGLSNWPNLVGTAVFVLYITTKGGGRRRSTLR